MLTDNSQAFFYLEPLSYRRPIKVSYNHSFYYALRKMNQKISLFPIPKFSLINQFFIIDRISVFIIFS